MRRKIIQREAHAILMYHPPDTQTVLFLVLEVATYEPRTYWATQRTQKTEDLEEAGAVMCGSLVGRDGQPNHYWYRAFLSDGEKAQLAPVVAVATQLARQFLQTCLADANWALKCSTDSRDPMSEILRQIKDSVVESGEL